MPQSDKVAWYSTGLVIGTGASFKSFVLSATSVILLFNFNRLAFDFLINASLKGFTLLLTFGLWEPLGNTY
jgi:hypothetical protein